MSKYQALADHLAQLEDDGVRLTFTQIEELVGSPLPESARQYDAWWANSRTNDTHTWAHLWLSAGWEKSALNLTDEWAEFRRFEYFSLDSKTAREGYEVDRKILARGRNRQLANERKRQDDYRCQACDFRLLVGENYVIEAHHLNPLSDSAEVRTTLEDLASLCPTCHRIAHLRSPPYDVDEISEIRNAVDDGD